jgi:hypothetical protein
MGITKMAVVREVCLATCLGTLILITAPVSIPCLYCIWLNDEKRLNRLEKEKEVRSKADGIAKSYAVIYKERFAYDLRSLNNINHYNV